MLAERLAIAAMCCNDIQSFLSEILRAFCKRFQFSEKRLRVVVETVTLRSKCPDAVVVCNKDSVIAQRQFSHCNLEHAGLRLQSPRFIHKQIESYI